MQPCQTGYGTLADDGVETGTASCVDDDSSRRRSTRLRHGRRGDVPRRGPELRRHTALVAGTRNPGDPVDRRCDGAHVEKAEEPGRMAARSTAGSRAVLWSRLRLPLSLALRP